MSILKRPLIESCLAHWLQSVSGAVRHRTDSAVALLGGAPARQHGPLSPGLAVRHHEGPHVEMNGRTIAPLRPRTFDRVKYSREMATDFGLVEFAFEKDPTR